MSLHTPDDELRDSLVPVNDRWKVAEVLDAAREYADTTGRRTFIVRRDGPNGEFLATPKNDDELAENAGAGDD